MCVLRVDNIYIGSSIWRSSVMNFVGSSPDGSFLFFLFFKK